MNRKNEKTFCGLSFCSMEKLKVHFSEMLKKYKNSHENVAGDDFRQLMALFEFHPDYHAKLQGGRVIRFYVDHHHRKDGGVDFESWSFRFETDTGIDDDFSFPKCVGAFWSAPIAEAAE